MKTTQLDSMRVDAKDLPRQLFDRAIADVVAHAKVLDCTATFARPMRHRNLPN